MANGSNETTVFNPDGSRTVVDTGHNVIVLFPTDVPAGPSTTLYVGRVEYRVDADEVLTIVAHSGRTVDICAELA